MNRVVKWGTVGILVALGTAPAKAATTNYWVQNVNLALTAYVQANAQVLRGSLPTKQFIAFLSGITNPALVSSQTVVPVTNNFYTNLTVEVTNFWLLPTNDLPRSYTVTSDYVVTPDGGPSYTNNIDFTNDIVVTRTTSTNVTYTFNNTVTVPTNRTAYVFPELPASSLTAVWTNDGPGMVFVLSGYVITNAVGTTTNYTYAKNPDFTKLRGAKLLYVTPIVDGTNYPSRYVVRYRDGRKNVDTDISWFMEEHWGSPYQAVYEPIPFRPQTRMYAFTQINFDNQAGTSFSFLGFDIQVWTALTSKGSVLSSSVLKQRKMTASNLSGYITGPVRNRVFKYNPTIVKGTIRIRGGRIE